MLAIFTEGNNTDDSNSTIRLASGMTLDELNSEKSKTIEKAANRRKNKILQNALVDGIITF